MASVGNVPGLRPRNVSGDLTRPEARRPGISIPEIPGGNARPRDGAADLPKGIPKDPFTSRESRPGGQGGHPRDKSTGVGGWEIFSFVRNDRSCCHSTKHDRKSRENLLGYALGPLARAPSPS